MRIRRSSRLAYFGVVLFACACDAENARSTAGVCRGTPDANRAIVLSFYREGLIARDPRAAFARYVAADFVEHKPDVSAGTRDSTAAFLARLMEELPGAAWEVHRTIAENDLVFLHASFTPAPGAPAYAIADVFRLRDCLIMEHWDAVGAPPTRSLNPNSRF